MDAVPTLVAALGLSGVQMLPRFLGRLHGAQRGRWLSAGAGLAVSFVFLEMVPQLVDRREGVADLLDGVPVLGDVHHLVFAGLLLFYGVEVLARRAHEHREDDEAAWPDQLAIGLFALYYALIGTLLWDQAEEGLGTLAVYAVAMALHFLVVDFGLREHHRDAYVRRGRWLLALAILVGWALGGLDAVPATVEGVALSVLAGALVLVALKEELPLERQSHFAWFAGSVAVCSALLAVM